jgi:tetratricopeptide (TPR) repeat protein
MKAAAAAVSFQKQLANAVSPSQALDIWLPMLTKLRNPADADPAAVIARRALASSAPDSDEEAKAHTVIGMGLLLKGDYAAAKDEFQIARRSPAYKPEKPWAKVVDEGLEAVVDPLAPYRTAVVLPPINLTTAAKSLDAGIAAFRAGKFKAAETALLDSAKNDPHNPVTWYFLGAARWEIGDDKQALKDFEEGSNREKVSPMPARDISTALRPLQGAVRDAIDKVRP